MNDIYFLQQELESAREARFFRSLTDDSRAFVDESDRLRVMFVRCVQNMLTETDKYMRGLAACWVADHATVVSERTAVVKQMRARFFETDFGPMTIVKDGAP